jgi:hypothetical protein
MLVSAGEAGFNAAVQIKPVSPKMNKPSFNEPDCAAPRET